MECVTFKQTKMRNIFSCLLLFILFSCTTKNLNTLQTFPYGLNEQKIDTIAVFVDSTDIGIPGNNKVWLANIVFDDSIPKAYVHFYSKKNNNWNVNYLFEDDHWSGDVLMPDIVDFNNDGYKDFKYLKGTGARGGNGINNLFIYDKTGDSLFHVVNSNEYPNLHYNKETNSINSYILTGGNETLFMRLDSNRLTPFASIDQYDKNIIVTVYDKNGKSKVIKEDTSGKYGEFAKFTNYNPLTVEQ